MQDRLLTVLQAPEDFFYFTSQSFDSCFPSPFLSYYYSLLLLPLPLLLLLLFLLLLLLLLFLFSTAWGRATT